MKNSLLFVILSSCLLLGGCSVAAMGMSAYTQYQVSKIQGVMIAKERGIVFDIVEKHKPSSSVTNNVNTDEPITLKVFSVRSGSDADVAGLKADDVIISVNGDIPNSSNLLNVVFFDKQSKPIIIKYRRDSVEITTQLMSL